MTYAEMLAAEKDHPDVANIVRHMKDGLYIRLFPGTGKVEMFLPEGPSQPADVCYDCAYKLFEWCIIHTVENHPNVYELTITGRRLRDEFWAVEGKP